MRNLANSQLNHYVPLRTEAHNLARAPSVSNRTRQQARCTSSPIIVKEGQRPLPAVPVLHIKRVRRSNREKAVQIAPQLEAPVFRSQWATAYPAYKTPE